MSIILITDDNAQNLYLARFLLEKEGHEIVEATNGQEAVDAVKKQSYDLILMDIQMPVMDGMQATKHIKNMNQQQKVVALTAKAMSGDKETIMACGFDGYIEKPIEPTGFANKVKTYL
jgi:CheY-like chemotaxis protein